MTVTTQSFLRVGAWTLIITALLAIGLLPAAAQATPQTYVVTSLADNGDVGTFRWAINQSNSNAGNDVITFQNGLTGTITLTSDLPSVIDLTINGTGESVITIDGAGYAGFTFGYFPPSNYPATSISLSGLTFTNFLHVLHVYGSYIADSVDVTISDITIMNSGDEEGISSMPPLLIGHCDLTITRLTMINNVGWHGGALTYGTSNPEDSLVMTDSTFIGNGWPQTSFGGALTIAETIDNSGDTATHYITNTTFIDNYTGGTGGAIFAYSGGIPNQTFDGRTNLIITNSTFSGNTAAEAAAIGLNENIDLKLYFSTFSGHDVDTTSEKGVLHAQNGATIEMVGSIIANNAAVGAPLECTIGNSSIFIGSYNLTSDNNCPSRIGVPTGIDSLLADNGGQTQTHALLAGSNAIDAYVGTDCPLIDQRGIARPLGLACDLGAYESDNFTAFPRIDLSKNTVNIGEDSTTDTYNIVLHTQPIADVIITIVTGPQTEVSPNIVTFTRDDWDIPQTVTVTAVNDLDIEGPHNSQITHTVNSMDSDYNNIYVGHITAYIVDNDVPAINLLETDDTTLTNEDGTSDTYALTLDTQPSADVIITLTTQDDIDVSPNTVTFTSTTWNIPQLVTVIAINDLIAESTHLGAIHHTVASADTLYNGMNVEDIDVSIIDDDEAGIIFNKLTLNVTEGGISDSYTVALTSQPVDTVTITIGANADIITNPTTLTFTPINWEIPQTVSITVVDDLIAKGIRFEVIQHVIASPDTIYDGLSNQNISAIITDNDTAGVTLSKTLLNIAEGGNTDSYTIVLNSQPMGNVYITSNNAPDIRLNPPSLSFNSVNWNVPRTVTITAYDELILEGDHTQTISYTINQSSNDYKEVEIDDIVANIIDNETAIYYIMDSNMHNDTVKISETLAGMNLAYPRIVLQVYGTGDGIFGVEQTIQVGYSVVGGTATNNGVDYTLNDGLITLPLTNLGATAAGFSIPIVDDMIDEETEYFTIRLAENEHGTSGNYDAAISPSPFMQSIKYEILDNDIAGVNITENFFRIHEGGKVETILINLNSKPTVPVVINTNHDNSQFTIIPETLVFTPENWNIQQTWTIAAIDDSVHEETFFKHWRITGTSDDEKYSGFLYEPEQSSPISLHVYVVDNDNPRITLSKTALTLSEGGDTDNYTLVLDSQPTADVTIAITDDAQCTADAETLTFTAANWNAPQTVIITAVNNAIQEGQHTCTISHVVNSTDTTYNGYQLTSVIGTITDNDSAGITLSKTALTLSEGGATDNYTLVLDSQPTADVTIAITDDAQCTADAETLTFTAANWNAPQTVIITAVNNAIQEGQRTCTISHIVNSTDTTYNGHELTSVIGTITDNDSAGITLSKTALTLSEGGTADSYTLVLDSQPTADVTIAITDDAQCTADAETLTFTAVNWNTPQTVMITAVDNAIQEGQRTCTISHIVNSADTTYNGHELPSVIGTITDNDSAGITLSKTALTLTEGGTDDSYTLVLDSQPTADVTIAITDDAQCTANAETLTFTAENWNLAQTVTVSATDDTVQEAQHACSITHTVSSIDLVYHQMALSAVNGLITDDEIAAVTTELLANGGFEVVANWTIQNASGDKRACPANVNNVHSGICAFKFTGSSTDKSTLTQNIDLSGKTFSAGDTLAVSAYFKGNHVTAKLKVTLFVYYTGNPTPVKTALIVRRNAGYIQHSLPTYTLTSGDISQIKVVLNHQSSGGTLWVDDVSLTHTIQAIISRGAILPLPVEPDSFRSNR